MDPEECLKEIRAQLLIFNLSTDDHELMTAAGKVCELVEAMDNWLSSGGFIPADWQNYYVAKDIVDAKTGPRLTDIRIHDVSVTTEPSLFPGAGVISATPIEED